MERNVDIDKISDGKRYGANDMVKVGCDDCRGCSACCRGMGDSIVLDRWIFTGSRENSAKRWRRF